MDGQKRTHEQVPHQKKKLIVFFDARGIVHFEFAPQGKTVSAAFYQEVLKRLTRRVARVRPDIKDIFKLHHNNAPSHTAFVFTNFVTQNKTSVLPPP